MNFGFHCSAGSLKAIAVSSSGRYMVCGGMDERLHIFNVEDNRAIGELSGHSGAVSSLAFIGDTYLLSGSEDSTICIWRIHDWQCLHILGGHKAGINSISVHPSGKLALSASKDNTLKTWNLVHGRCAFTRRLRGPADKVLWHAGGEHYLLVIGSELQMYNIEDNKVCAASFSFTSRINQAVFTNAGKNVTSLDEMCIAVICDDKSLHLVDTTGRKITVDMTHMLDGSRARDMWSCRAASVGGEEMREVMQDEGDSLAIVTSSGLLTVLSCHALAQNAEQAGDREDGGDASDIAHAVLSSTHISAQPRLTAVVAWVPALSPTPVPQHDAQKSKSAVQVSDGAGVAAVPMESRKRKAGGDQEVKKGGSKKAVRFAGAEEEEKGEKRGGDKADAAGNSAKGHHGKKKNKVKK